MDPVHDPERRMLHNKIPFVPIKVGFDLDGTLDRPPVLALARALIDAGHEVHVITGKFPDGEEWQGTKAKHRKMKRLGLYSLIAQKRFHVVDALPVTPLKNLDYVLRDLGLRKGALCEQLGIVLFFDDSATYCEMIGRMSGTMTLQIR